MNAADAIADLDAELLEAGQDVVLQRLALNAGVQSVAAQVTCRGVVRGYRPQELGGGGPVGQDDCKVILGPTEIAAAGWQSGRPAHEDGAVPMKGNRVMIAGRSHNVEAAAGIYLAGTLVRIELQVRG